MDDYEVELIDYLRVIWWGKWILLGCLVIALLAAGAVVYTRPDRYEAKASLLLRETISVFLSRDEAGATLDLPDSVPAPDGRFTISVAQDKTGGVTVTARGTASPAEVERALGTGIETLRERLARQVTAGVLQAVTAAELRAGQLSGQIARLRAQMSAETSDPVVPFLAEQIAALEAQLARDVVLTEQLTSMPGERLFSLTEIERTAARKVDTSRKTTLAVAGFLGLFLGVLLVFFVHYLVTIRQRERRPKPAAP